MVESFGEWSEPQLLVHQLLLYLDKNRTFNTLKRDFHKNYFHACARENKKNASLKPGTIS